MPERDSKEVATVLRAGASEVEPGIWVVFVFDMLGCFSAGSTPEEAVSVAGDRVRTYYQWLGSKDGGYPSLDGPIRIELIERQTLTPCQRDSRHKIRAFFEDDTRALRLWDVELSMRLLEWNRQDLDTEVQKMGEESLAVPRQECGGRTPEDILMHVARSENWLLSRLGASLKEECLPTTFRQALQTVRARLVEALPEWVEMETEVEICGEKWSPRKVLRYVLWHERDHIQQLSGISAPSAGVFTIDA